MSIGIRPSANSVKVKRVVRLETSVCFPHYNVDEQPNKKPKKSYFPKRRESDDKSVVYHKIQIHWFLKVESLWKTDAESLGNNLKSTIHMVNATSSEYPGKERTIVGKNKCPCSSSEKSLRYEI